VFVDKYVFLSVRCRFLLLWIFLFFLLLRRELFEKPFRVVVGDGCEVEGLFASIRTGFFVTLFLDSMGFSSDVFSLFDGLIDIVPKYLEKGLLPLSEGMQELPLFIRRVFLQLLLHIRVQVQAIQFFKHQVGTRSNEKLAHCGAFAEHGKLAIGGEASPSRSIQPPRCVVLGLGKTHDRDIRGGRPRDREKRWSMWGPSEQADLLGVLELGDDFAGLVVPAEDASVPRCGD